MREFTIRKIAGQQSLGESLAQQRAARSLTIEQVAHQLNINPSYLQALELGDHAQLPGTVYAVCFLKAYARLLDLDADALVQRYKSELKISQHGRGETADQWRPVRRASWWHFLVPARLARNALLGLVLLLTLTYLGFKVEAIVEPPLLVVSSPADEVLTDNPLVMVSGQTEPGGAVAINGQEVLPDAQGRFTAPLDLQTGVNLIKISVRKNHSNESVILRRVILQPREP